MRRESEKRDTLNESNNGLRRITSRIIGADIERGFPAVCKIEVFKRKSQLRDPLKVFNCTGTLIAPRLVVFAAHCVEKGLIASIRVTFEFGNTKHRFKVGVHNLSYDLSYRQSVIGDTNASLSQKLQMSQRDIAFLVIPDPQNILASISPMAMMPLKNLKALKLLGRITELTAVGFGRYSNVDDVNRGESGKKRSARFDSWSISNQGMIRIKSQRNVLPATGEPTNIARGDSGGAVICIYQGVQYLVGVISFYNYADARNVNIAESFAVSCDFVDRQLVKRRGKMLRAAKEFSKFRQSYAPYGFNFKGFEGNSFKTIASDALFQRVPRLRELVDPSILQPSGLEENPESFQDVELFGEVKWFRDPRFQLALACAPIAILAIMGLRIGLEFDDE